MTAHDDAVEAGVVIWLQHWLRSAPESGNASCACGWKSSGKPDWFIEWREHYVGKIVDAAAPILLAEAKRVFETLTVTSKAREEQVERLIAEVARWKALVDAKQSWIDGAKVDLAAAEAEIERLQADLRQSVRAIDHYAGALRTTPEIVAAERARIEALFEQRHYPGRVWTLMDLRAVVHHPAPAETAPEEDDHA